jgi:hypothetical protein
MAHVTGVEDLKNDLLVKYPTFRDAPDTSSLRPKFLGFLKFRGRGDAHAKFSVCSGQGRGIQDNA